MNRVITFGFAALLVTAGAAGAGEPMLLTDAELDRVTGGPLILQVPVEAHGPPDRVAIRFADEHPAQPLGDVRFTADPGFDLRPPSPVPNER